MARHLWCLTLAACALSAVAASGSGRSSGNDGVCWKLTEYVIGDGRKATDGISLTYCAGEQDCHKTPVRVCCNGWRRDPSSKKLRCIKTDPNDSASTGAADFVTDLGSADDNASVRRVRDAQKTDPGAQKDAPGSAPAESTTVKTDQSGQNASSNAGPNTPSGSQQTSNSPESGHTASQKQPVSGPRAENGTANTDDLSTNRNASTSDSTPTVAGGSVKVSGRTDNQTVPSPVPTAQNSLKNLTANGDGKAGTGAVQSNNTNTSVTPVPASTDSSHSLTNGKQVVTTQNNNTNATQSEPNRVTIAPPPAISNKDTTDSSTTQLLPPPGSSPDGSGASQEPSKNVSSPASGEATSTAGQAQAPPPVEGQPAAVQLESKNGTTNHSVIGKSEVVAPPPVKEDDSEHHVVTVATRGPEVPATVHNASTTDQTVATAASKVQPQGTESTTSGPSPAASSLEHAGHGETTPPICLPQVSSAPTSPTSTSKAAVTAGTSVSTAGAAAQQPPVVSTTHPAQNTSDNSVHTGSFAPRSTTTATTQPTQSSSNVSKSTSVPATQHPITHPDDNTHEYKVRENKNSTSQRASVGNPSVATGQQGNASATNVTEKTGNGTSVANCTAGYASNCSVVNCSYVEDQKNCTYSNSTAPLSEPTSPPVAKPLGDKPPASSTAVPSSSSASKTASEVTISLLLVAAVGFVAALLYWRSRRRRRRYINCGTREPNLNFSNPVYDLEAMMEQTSLMKLQNAAEIEDGEADNSEPEATFQRK